MPNDILPFHIQVKDDQLADLKARLAMTRWPERETPEDWSQGVPLVYMQELAAYWQNEYDWRVAEKQLNKLPQFTTQIDGLDIHFLHVQSPHKDARPLVMTHGWPGSILEFMKVIQPLTDPAKHGGQVADAVHLVLPSLPGFGFSGKPTTTGWGVEKIADAWAVLMQRLGYERYLAQGGDWGSMVTAAIGTRDPDHCAGIHMNMPIVDFSEVDMTDLTELEQSALAALNFYQEWDSGYSKQQSTRPQTIGYGLVDSPAGLLGWIIEKFHAWTDCQGHPENVLTKDELLNNVMLYWLSSSGASSARIYWESFNKTPIEEVQVPAGCSLFPKEIFKLSERWARARFKKLVYWDVLDKGGHFAAFEQPDLFIQELRKCFRKMPL